MFTNDDETRLFFAGDSLLLLLEQHYIKLKIEAGYIVKVSAKFVFVLLLIASSRTRSPALESATTPICVTFIY